MNHERFSDIAAKVCIIIIAIYTICLILNVIL